MASFNPPSIHFDNINFNESHFTDNHNKDLTLQRMMSVLGAWPAPWIGAQPGRPLDASGGAAKPAHSAVPRQALSPWHFRHPAVRRRARRLVRTAPRCGGRPTAQRPSSAAAERVCVRCIAWPSVAAASLEASPASLRQARCGLVRAALSVVAR